MKKKEYNAELAQLTEAIKKLQSFDKSKKETDFRGAYSDLVKLHECMVRNYRKNARRNNTTLINQQIADRAAAMEQQYYEEVAQDGKEVSE